MGQIAAILGSITAVITGFTLLIKEVVKLKRELFSIIDRNTVSFAVYGEVPDELATYPIFSNYRKFRACKSRVKVLLVRQLSFGLRKCDFVIADHDDIKIINKDNDERIKSILRVRLQSIEPLVDN
jgi:hypothetical protein